MKKDPVILAKSRLPKDASSLRDLLGYLLSPYFGVLCFLGRTAKKNLTKRYVVLLEVLIAMALTMGLLSFLFASYSQIEYVDAQIEKENEHSFRKLYLSARLAAILPKAISNSANDSPDFFFGLTQDGGNPIKSGTPSLIFAFDNGVQLDAEFSKNVLGRLYVDESNRLCLAIWPGITRWQDPPDPPTKHEVLFENVEGIHFEFYVPPLGDRKMIWEKNERKITEGKGITFDIGGGWRSEWQPEYELLPPLIRITLTLTSKMQNGENEKVILTYPLPMSPLFILYNQ